MPNLRGRAPIESEDCRGALFVHGVSGGRLRSQLGRGVAFGVLATIATATTVALTFSLQGCDDARFPVCHSNADCLALDAGILGFTCFNLRCVECRYDSDCGAGKLCTRNQTCEPLGGTQPQAREGPDASPTRWSHGTFEECAAECRDEACLRACNRRYED